MELTAEIIGSSDVSETRLQAPCNRQQRNGAASAIHRMHALLFHVICKNKKYQYYAVIDLGATPLDANLHATQQFLSNGVCSFSGTPSGGLLEHVVENVKHNM
ncbi:hypothetical protein CEXT_486721 [Caerostris extrusa]|uniref:Uncharacterized protein n=1 Tax=Caerostris extrusa TaxID=172846 RepID=A0AAV4MGU2_CAEEX|nr:hypothetical protein CEXT_486721 [Caerostris extrusa]